MWFNKRGESSQGQNQSQGRRYEAARAAQVGNNDEQWDIYYHAFLLHTCLHSQCYWYRSTWWFPEPGRNERTLSMFSPSRFPPVDTITCICRYIGPDTPEEGWLGDYVGYNLNSVTFDMKAINH
ncbi:uncharacterized protein IL334_003482 [Kwoniella shivajii]|uniref:Uncharacterized protein n=1 Tax=Kwoniella shivajii TaxID=564305 RepID=A0ABZ1CY86_9TREE|nr:hypothetical protein IL334_003482 [Kwoniella shivajii]